jgi:hypothetical protein
VASDRITLRGTEAEKQLQALRRLLRRRPAKITYRELRDGWRRFQDALPPQRYVLPSYGNPHRDTSNLGTAIDELDFETCERQFMGQQSSASRQDNSSSSQGSVHPPFSQGQASSTNADESPPLALIPSIGKLLHSFPHEHKQGFCTWLVKRRSPPASSSSDIYRLVPIAPQSVFSSRLSLLAYDGLLGILGCGITSGCC